MSSGDRCVPGKRLRNWHRIAKAIMGETAPLGVFARRLAANGSTGPARERQAIAKLWLVGKGARLSTQAVPS